MKPIDPSPRTWIAFQQSPCTINRFSGKEANASSSKIIETSFGEDVNENSRVPDGKRNCLRRACVHREKSCFEESAAMKRRLDKVVIAICEQDIKDEEVDEEFGGFAEKPFAERESSKFLDETSHSGRAEDNDSESLTVDEVKLEMVEVFSASGVTCFGNVSNVEILRIFWLKR